LGSVSRGVSKFFFVLLCASSAIANSSEAIPAEVKSAFAPWTVKPPFRNRFEDFEIKSIDGKKTLLVNVWYETASVTKTGKPDSALFCRIVHTTIFGRHLDRSRARGLPISLAFERIPDLSAVRVNFFTQYLTNKPLPPEWAQKPVASATKAVDDTARLRVIWGREEKILNYLSYSMERGEWQTLRGLIKPSSNTNHEDFANNLCPSVLKIAPNIRSNFTEIQNELIKARSGGKTP